MSTRVIILKDGVIKPATTSDNISLISSLGVVDRTTNQTIGGVKTFSSPFILSSTSGTSIGGFWRNADNLEYKDSTNTTRVILNSAGNLNNLGNRQIALNNLVGTQTANRILRSDGTNVTLSQIALDTDVVNVLSIANGGTGSNTQNFVDLANIQNINGSKYFLSPLSVGLGSDLSVKTFTNSDIRQIPSAVISSLHHLTGSLNFTENPPLNIFGFLSADFDVNAASTVAITTTTAAGHFKVRHLGSGQITTLQGLRLSAQNAGTGNITLLEGAYFLARNDGVGTTVTTLNGGSFTASLQVASTATTINGGNFVASASSTSNATTVRGINVIAGSQNTTPATNCIGIEIANVTGTATNKYAIKTGTGQVYFGDTLYVAGAINSTSIVKIQSNVPGFWLDELDGGTKGAYLVLDAGVLQIQRRATDFGAFEATVAQINILTGLTNFLVNVPSTSTTTGTIVCGGGMGVTGNIYAGGTIQGTSFQVSGTKVVGARETGWTAGTGTPLKSTFAADTATLIQTAQRTLAIEQALRTHGLIN